MGAGNVARDPGQRTVGLALELKAVVDDADRMGSPMPFANEARAGFDLWPRRRRDPPARFEFRGQGHQSALRRFGPAAMGDFLQPVGDGAHHHIAAQPRRLGAKESPPFQTQISEAEGRQDRETIRQLACAVRRRCRSFGPDFRIVQRRLGVVLVETSRPGGSRSIRLGGRTTVRPLHQALQARLHGDHEAVAGSAAAR